jgi:hypothetical protein
MIKWPSMPLVSLIFKRQVIVNRYRCTSLHSETQSSNNRGFYLFDPVKARDTDMRCYLRRSTPRRVSLPHEPSRVLPKFNDAEGYEMPW